MGTHSLSYRTNWWMLSKLGRDEVIMALHMCLDFSAKSAQRWIQVGVYCLYITDALEYGVPRCANWINNWRLHLGKRVIYTTGNQLHWLNMEPNRLHRFRMHTWQVHGTLNSQWGAFSNCSLYSGERSVPLGALVRSPFVKHYTAYHNSIHNNKILLCGLMLLFSLMKNDTR